MKLLTVFKKEVRENLRDRRSVMSSLLMGPLMGPVIFAVMISMIAKMESEKAEEVLKIPVQGQDLAPQLIAHLKQQGVEIEAAPEDIDAEVKAENIDVALVITEEFGTAFEDGRPAPITMVFDKSRREIGTTTRRVRSLLESYGQTVGALRLVARGVDPAIVRAVAVEERDLSTPQSRGALLLAMLPYFLMIAVFMGGMYLAIDATAGERERKSMEPLLICPVPRWQVMGGKLLATTCFALASLAITLVAFSQSMKMIPAETMGLNLSLGLTAGLLLFVLVSPIALLASALQTVISAFAKTFREAQTYLSVLLLVPMIPSLAMFVVPVKGELWMYSIPIFGQNLLIDEVLSGEQVQVPAALLSMASSIVVALLFAWIAARLYRSERLAVSD